MDAIKNYGVSLVRVVLLEHLFLHLSILILFIRNEWPRLTLTKLSHGKENIVITDHHLHSLPVPTSPKMWLTY